jgi:hypothetical protein
MNSAEIEGQSADSPPGASVHKPVPVLDAASLSSVIAEEPLLSAQGGSTPMDVANISADQVSSLHASGLIAAVVIWLLGS